MSTTKVSYTVAAILFVIGILCPTMPEFLTSLNSGMWGIVPNLNLVYQVHYGTVLMYCAIGAATVPVTLEAIEGLYEGKQEDMKWFYLTVPYVSLLAWPFVCVSVIVLSIIDYTKRGKLCPLF